jgi:multicomponent Na+:H+ antiporter subunit G
MTLYIALEWLRFAVAAVFMFVGLLTLIATNVGLFRFGYVLNCIHVAAKCDALGLLLTFTSLIIMKGFDFISLKLMLIIIFMWVANPVTVHLISLMEVTNNPQDGLEYEVVHRVPD